MTRYKHWRPRVDESTELPLAQASIFSRLAFWWVSPIMSLGFKRPLEETDIWKLDASRESAPHSTKFDECLRKRQRNGPRFTTRLYWSARTRLQRSKPHSVRRAELEQKWQELSIVAALFDTFPMLWWVWPWRLVGDVCMILAPLVMKEIIKFSQQGVPNVPKGVGLAFALFAMTTLERVCINQYAFLTGELNTMTRSALAGSLYSRGMLQPLPAGTLMTHLMVDINHIASTVSNIHLVWIQFLVIAAIVVLLCLQIGVSGLVGLLVFVALAPVQTYITKYYYRLRRTTTEFTEKRTTLLHSLLSAMGTIKMFTYELPCINRLQDIRSRELERLQSMAVVESANMAITESVPNLAAVCAFVMYSGLGHEINPALIFPAITLLGELQNPLNFLPRLLNGLVDAYNGVKRVNPVFHAELSPRVPSKSDLDVALRADASFHWSEKFSINLNLEVPWGHLVAIIGPVGSGKSSILQGLIGEMPCSGTFVFGGRVAYCEQTAWIQNATVRDNIVFGQPWDEEWYWQCVRAACLNTDLEALPNGDATEIGEKGINLSGGQKQRVNIARALYFKPDVILMDNPLSALDARVGRTVFNAILGLRRAGKTVILVTHALHLLPHVDIILTVKDGIVETCNSYGDVSETLEPTPESTERNDTPTEELITAEERKRGGSGIGVYLSYLSAHLYSFAAAVIFASAMQVATVMSNVWITYWETDHFERNVRFYQGVYAALGIAGGALMLASGVAMSFTAIAASRKFYQRALRNLFAGPMSYFHTTPVGRIMGIMGRDMDVVDNDVGPPMTFLVRMVVGVVGSIIVIAIAFPYFVTVVAGVGLIYAFLGVYYRPSSREMRRINGITRGKMISHFSESLAGRTTIRLYEQTSRFIEENAHRIDQENRSFYTSLGGRMWMAARLAGCGNVIVLAVALMCTTTAIPPGQVGLCLAYTASITGMLGALIQLWITLGVSMVSVERVEQLSGKHFKQESPYETLGDPSKPWPIGHIQFDNVSLAYREGLRPVLNNITFSISPGERVGIVGRTGAGKTSITIALFRLAELSGGRIFIDGVDIATIGLKSLRSAMAVVPQEPELFGGTLRANLDPIDEHNDSALHDALERANLKDVTLDMKVEDGGKNLSVGQRCLISLARALLKHGRIIVMDEATAAVDLETDVHIQQALEDCTDKTIICIAHRLRTVIGFDKILVMDAGSLSDFDTPLTLFDQGGLFRTMCDQSNITREDILPLSVPQ